MTAEALNMLGDIVAAGQFAEYLLEKWSKQRNLESLLEAIQQAIVEKDLVKENLEREVGYENSQTH